jgi:hypothetical protein
VVDDEATFCPYRVRISFLAQFKFSGERSTCGTKDLFPIDSDGARRRMKTAHFADGLFADLRPYLKQMMNRLVGESTIEPELAKSPSYRLSGVFGRVVDEVGLR